MRKRGLCCRLVSVRPSAMLVYRIHTAEDIVKLLSRPGGAIIRRRYPVPRYTFCRGAKYTGRMGFFFMISTEITVIISETVRHRPMVAMER